MPRAVPEAAPIRQLDVRRATPPKREQLAYWLGHFGQIDQLTKLPNRSQFLDRLSAAMVRAIRSNQLVGVMLLNLGDLAVTATVGVAFFPTDADNGDTLLQNADVALWHARDHDRNTCQFYSLELPLQSPNDEPRRAAEPFIPRRTIALTVPRTHGPHPGDTSRIKS